MIFAIQKAEKASGEKGFITLQTLRAELSTGAWAALEDSESPLVGVLMSEAFKRMGKDGTPET